MGDTFRVFPLLVRWVGFKVAALDVKHGKRHSGETSYSLGRLLRLALTGVLAFSDKPLRNIVGLGFLASGGGFAYAAWILFRKLAWGIDVPGWASVIVSLWLLAGLQMIVIGIVGLYVGRTFEAGLKRPIYILRETKNL
jgi:dolichol-phosphate mannosyltransferase